MRAIVFVVMTELLNLLFSRGESRALLIYTVDLLLVDSSRFFLLQIDCESYKYDSLHDSFAYKY